MEPTPTNDIALAVIGGSGTLASILLVFVGFMMMKAEGLSENASVSAVRRYTLPAKLGLIPMVEHVIVMACSYLWLFYPTSTYLYKAWTIGFVVGLILFAAYSIFVTLRL